MSGPNFICGKCEYSCLSDVDWQQHIESDAHKNEGKRKQRCDKILEPQCKLCSFKTNNLTNMRAHMLTKHLSKKERQYEFKFYCDKCDFGTFGEILFTRHLETKKHNK